MERVIEAIPRYTPLLQKPFCCSCACVQMVLLRRGMKVPLQDEIARATGVSTDKTDAGCFMRSLRIMPKPSFETATKRTEGIYNSFFRKINVPIKVRAFKVSDVKNHEKFISQHLKAGNDIHVELSMMNVTGRNNAHDCILSKIRFGKKTTVTIIDPFWANKQYHEIELKTLLKSMDCKWFGRELGFLIYYEK